MSLLRVNKPSGGLYSGRCGARRGRLCCPTAEVATTSALIHQLSCDCVHVIKTFFRCLKSQQWSEAFIKRIAPVASVGCTNVRIFNRRRCGPTQAANILLHPKRRLVNCKTLISRAIRRLHVQLLWWSYSITASTGEGRSLTALTWSSCSWALNSLCYTS